jgi:hypothetical protein
MEKLRELEALVSTQGEGEDEGEGGDGDLAQTTLMET